MSAQPSPFGDISIETFLQEYWQKKPLLIRNAFPDLEPPVGPDDLAGLACEEEVEARLVIQDPANDAWELKHGPFDEETFASLPEDNWTLLVQAVDHWAPDATALVEQFRFLPNWRYDDLMVSFASQGGGVGPHYDNYDVFLIQTQGKRRWEVGGFFDQNSPRRPNMPVMIIPDWQPEHTWVLEPGDMLYIPPQVGHNGVSESDDCMTYSVGFRAPSHAEVLRSFTDFVGEKLTSESRYSDPGIATQTNPGEISADALTQIRGIFNQYLNDESQVAQWLGEYVTDPKYPDIDQTPEDTITLEQLQNALTDGDLLLNRNEGSRFSYYSLGENKVLLFADGESFECDGESSQLAQVLCQTPHLVINQGDWSEQALTLLVSLFNQGSVYCE